MDKTILVVEDLAPIREHLAGKVVMLGFKAIEAVNGRDALNILESGHQVDGIITDNQMPLMNGRQFVRAVRSNLKLAHLPIVMVSGDTLNLEAFCREWNVPLFPKPAKAEDLIGALLGQIT